jgi:ATP-dependent protease ClpP protease subunit
MQKQKKNIEDILIFIRSRGLRLTKDMTIMDLINLVKRLPSEK